ncbi:13819_t:CDS:10 [Funneliformis caledonium]|uniref:13819_t:CDS:1 n=1 Tax=Funneliformis caledonium TaxID=1117310 RepID=A0A9N9GUQ9_9GLOM|nr:13819_t:CDS:10 [Funneliformis caledonium]
MIKGVGIIKRAPKHVEIVENAYILKFTITPSLDDRKKHVEIIKQHEYFHAEIKKKGLNITVRYEFYELINAISFEIKEDDLEKIVEIVGVQSIEPVQKHQILPTSSNMKVEIESKYTQMSFDKRDWIPDTPLNLSKDANLNSIHKMMGVDLVHNKLGYYGKGIKVGIVDTGIDYLHPALGGCFGPGCRVEYGYNYLEDTWDPRDVCVGHGTHIAGIIGANDSMHSGFIGIAPQITFGAYRTMDCEGKGEGDVVMTALQRAKDDGMNIINLSMGGTTWTTTPLSKMIDALTRSGIIVVTANGNVGNEGIFESVGELLESDAISVGSIDNTHYLTFKAYDVSDKNFSIDYVTVSARAFTFSSAKVEIFPDYECPTNFQQYESKVVLVTLDTCPLDCVWIGNLQKFQALGILLVTEITLGPTLANFNNAKVTIPTATVTPNIARLIKDKKKEKSNLEMDFSEKTGYYISNPIGYSMSYFSSWGLSNDLEIKELVAPGGIIFSTYPIHLGSYAQLLGTSMSTACVAGALALYIEANKSSRNARDMLKLYSKPIYDTQNDEKASVLQQGAGLINIYNSIISTTVVTPFKKSSLKGTQLFDNQYLDIQNYGKEEITYRLKHVPAISVNGYNGTRSVPTKYMKFNHSTAIVQFEKDQVTVQPGCNVKVLFTISPPNDLVKEQRWFYSGFIQVEPQDQSSSPVTIPYAGFAGDLRSLPILGQPEFPQIRKSNTTISSDTTTPTTFTMNNSENKPIISIIISTPTKLLLIHALNSDKQIIGLLPGVNDLMALRTI